MATTVLGPLAASNPVGTTAVTLYTPGANEEVTVKVTCVNLDSSPVTISLYMDPAGGALYDGTTTKAKDIMIPAGRKYVDYILMNGAANDLGVKTDTANMVAFSAEGVVRS